MLCGPGQVQNIYCIEASRDTCDHSVPDGCILSQPKWHGKIMSEKT